MTFNVMGCEIIGSSLQGIKRSRNRYFAGKSAKVIERKTKDPHLCLRFILYLREM
jgi:ribosomal protein L34E